ncbi:sulfite exporter TauE/SafE family protein [Holophaga foetida]|uniref:sulfite exporter TauE/SafE family protein n=1 Tax=Holophaga foetida TaxID=35839 RepID=UPI0002474267|nr:sulfite exporter TauE/SafE family protein [Holophaga foetida]
MAAPMIQYSAGLVSGWAGGVLSGLFGLGGGLVLIPLLGAFLSLGQHQAQGLTLAAMLLPNGLPAVLEYRRRGIRLWGHLTAFLILGFLIGAWGGARAANLIPAKEMRWIFIAFLCVMALRTLLKGDGSLQNDAPGSLAIRNVWLPGVLTGLVGGLASGLLGIGGGVIMIPMLAGWLKLSQHEAQLASLTMMLAPVGLPAVWVYARSEGGLPWFILAGVASGFMVGAYLGARIAGRIRGPKLRVWFACITLAMAILLAIRG